MSSNISTGETCLKDFLESIEVIFVNHVTVVENFKKLHE